MVDYPGLTGKWRVSVDGGFLPCWSVDGRELFFTNLDRKIMSAAVSTDRGFQVARPVRILGAAPELYGYAQAPDGKGFLALVDARGEKLPATQVIVNWQALVRRK